MNDRPSSGQYPDFGYDGLSTTTFAGNSAFASYETQGQGYNYGAAYGSYDTGSYDTTAWTAPQNGYAQPSADGYAGYDGYLSTVPAQGGVSMDYQSTAFGYETSAEQTGHWSVPGYGTETGAYDATAWNTAPEQTYGYTGYEQQQQQPQHVAEPAQEQAHEQQYAYDYGYEPYAATSPEGETAYTETAVFEYLPTGADAEGADVDFHADADADARVHDLPTQAMPVTPAGPAEPRPSRRAGSKPGSKPVAKASTAKAGANNRRRTPAKRSALLTVAVPSACVMGVAGVAAASVGGLTGADKPSEETTTLAAPDPASIKPVAANSKLDTQLTALSADAGDFADRASRTQERIDLRLRQDEEKKKKAEEEAAKEAARPKFALPVARHGLSAGFGQAGVNWMSVHTGIDFPVGYGTSVMAATDGTVRSQFNSAYGNMVILTAPDGTETWYCHLSSAKIRSGKVKAGDVIAYSGDTGNSTGPHLHFEVRPGGGSPVDPQAWLRAKGLNPN
ncbi:MULTISPECIES: M23 family metallopeptidase [unclassified Streptomyces]|uniref:M23 family metallopeptidase n=1 Tax=Streptomyces sp. NBC_00347 TaxID=2975721 RepID=UPI00202F2380|nr:MULTISPECIES: peptidoglycan DD-metalloendopeptidase family protein [unclassified Streptomyces]MCM1970413.1 peptidoglycan DD-metalloendopeptidase family protein [Streptomyces sp. G1]MCX5123037.1 peptidoglycan DD-metalloendopeptidase family protein [Streptomyces sp. NBC_00347]